MKTSTFTAVDEQGNRYTVTKTVRRKEISALSATTKQYIDQLPSYQIAGYGAVEPAGDSAFKIVATGVIIRQV